MSLLYVTEHGARIGLDGGHIVIGKGAEEKRIPKHTVDGICVFGNGQVSTQCIRFCMENSIALSYFSQSGRYLGRITTTEQTATPSRLKKQIRLAEDTDCSLAFGKSILVAKVLNQSVVVRRYLGGASAVQAKKYFSAARNAKKGLKKASSTEQLMGYEGLVSRNYFDALSSVVAPEFGFTGRNRRPPKDPINAMLSMGYSILMKEITGVLDSRGLNVSYGFLHATGERRPSLVCDMIEEWRPVIVDSVTMSLVQGHEISLSDFEWDESECRLSDSERKIFLAKMEKKMFTETKYLLLDRPISFREAIGHQADLLAAAIDKENLDLYNPVVIR